MTWKLTKMWLKWEKRQKEIVKAIPRLSIAKIDNWKGELKNLEDGIARLRF